MQRFTVLNGRHGCSVQITAQINIFMIAGYETTASALAFTAYCVAAHPEAENKLLQEIDSFGRTAVPSYEDLDKVRGCDTSTLTGVLGLDARYVRVLHWQPLHDHQLQAF